MRFEVNKYYHGNVGIMYRTFQVLELGSNGWIEVRELESINKSPGFKQEEEKIWLNSNHFLWIKEVDPWKYFYKDWSR